MAVQKAVYRIYAEWQAFFDANRVHVKVMRNKIN